MPVVARNCNLKSNLDSATTWFLFKEVTRHATLRRHAGRAQKKKTNEWFELNSEEERSESSSITFENKHKQVTGFLFLFLFLKLFSR